MYIYRVDRKRTGGWRVVRSGKSKYFSDRKHGGKSEALKAAEEYERTLPPGYARRAYTIETHPDLFAQVKKRSGVFGVHGSIKRIGSNEYYFWVAQKRMKKSRKTKKFSVSKYGPMALQMAIETRQAWDTEQKDRKV